MYVVLECVIESVERLKPSRALKENPTLEPSTPVSLSQLGILSWDIPPRSSLFGLIGDELSTRYGEDVVFRGPSATTVERFAGQHTQFFERSLLGLGDTAGPKSQ